MWDWLVRTILPDEPVYRHCGINAPLDPGDEGGGISKLNHYRFVSALDTRGLGSYFFASETFSLRRTNSLRSMKKFRLASVYYRLQVACDSPD